MTPGQFDEATKDFNKLKAKHKRTSGHVHKMRLIVNESLRMETRRGIRNKILMCLRMITGQEQAGGK